MKSLPKLTILGGSSPFTIEFINCICAVSPDTLLGPYHLILFGRNAKNLELIFRYAKFNLTKIGWKVDINTNINEALDGASVIIHQNRYGGFEGRLEDEAFANEHATPADETLGPSGLKSAVRMTPYLKVLAKKILSLCPDALVINLTNPLSIAVSVLHEEGVSSTIGICELPLVTLDKVAGLLKIPVKHLEWEYSGLNHRGFIHNLKFEGKDLLPLILKKIADLGFEGFHCSEIENLEAIPLKYFQLFSKNHHTPGRAGQVKVIGDRIIDELILNPFKSPTSLKDRTMDWYKKGLIPVLKAINSSEPNILIINKPEKDEVTIESKASVSNKTIYLIKSVKAPAKVCKWLNIFTEHEKAVFKAAMDPSLNNFKHALNTDPLVALSHVNDISKSLFSHYLKEHEQTNA